MKALFLSSYNIKWFFLQSEFLCGLALLFQLAATSIC